MNFSPDVLYASPDDPDHGQKVDEFCQRLTAFLDAVVIEYDAAKQSGYDVKPYETRLDRARNDIASFRESLLNARDLTLQFSALKKLTDEIAELYEDLHSVFRQPPPDEISGSLALVWTAVS